MKEDFELDNDACWTCGGYPDAHPSGTRCICEDGTHQSEVFHLRQLAAKTDASAIDKLAEIFDGVLDLEHRGPHLLALRFKDGMRLSFIGSPTDGKLNAVVIQKGDLLELKKLQDLHEVSTHGLWDHRGEDPFAVGKVVYAESRKGGTFFGLVPPEAPEIPGTQYERCRIVHRDLMKEVAWFVVDGGETEGSSS